MQASTSEYVGAALFAIAVLHTFLTKWCKRLAHRQPQHAGLRHLLREVEVVFGFWALVLVGFMAFIINPQTAVGYLESRNFTEPLFVLVILVIAGTKPVLYAAQQSVDRIVGLLPLRQPVAAYLVCLSVVPLLGSFITEPAAMTLAALMLRDRYYKRKISECLKYATLAVLLVNVSIGGVLTSYAAPPVLMVAETWGWNTAFMASVFGWKVAAAVFINAAAATWLFRKELSAMSPSKEHRESQGVPALAMALLPTTVAASCFMLL